MVEGNGKQNPELNEAALEGVSGGLTYPSNLHVRAQMICSDCRRDYRGQRSCSGDPDKLEQYMQKNGAIANMTECPYK